MPHRNPAAGARLKRLKARRRPTQQRAQQSVEALLDAARTLIERDGLDRMTTKSIAKAAGRSVGAVYEYFPNKKSILLELGTRWMRGMREAIAALHPAQSGISDAFTYRLRVVEEAERHYRDQPGLGAVIASLQAVPELREVMHAHDAQIADNFVSVMLYFHPDADRDELVALGRSMTEITHSILSSCLVYRSGDPERMLRHLRMAQLSLITPIIVSSRLRIVSSS